MCGSMRHIRRWGASMFNCRRNRLRRGAYPATSGEGDLCAMQVFSGESTGRQKFFNGHQEEVDGLTPARLQTSYWGIIPGAGLRGAACWRIKFARASARAS